MGILYDSELGKEGLERGPCDGISSKQRAPTGVEAEAGGDVLRSRT